MSQTKPQNIPSSTKPVTDQKTPKQAAGEGTKNAGGPEEQQKDKNPQTAKNHSSQK